MNDLLTIGLKVCGMRDLENIMDVAAVQPDYLGFIFYQKSPRFVGKDFKMPDIAVSTKKVGVFVNAGTDEMLKLRDEVGLHYLQLHGNEPVQQLKELKRAGAGIFKVFSIGDDFNFEVTKEYAEFADFFLFDTKGKYYGGNARQFNWSVLERYDQRIPFLLSGGLTPESIPGITSLRGMNLHALDVNSGVEESPGRKDVRKVCEAKEALEIINNRN